MLMLEGRARRIVRSANYGDLLQGIEDLGDDSQLGLDLKSVVSKRPSKKR